MSKDQVKQLLIMGSIMWIIIFSGIVIDNFKTSIWDYDPGVIIPNILYIK